MIPNVTPQPRARERYQRLVALMDVCEQITDKGWLVDLAKLEAHRLTANARVDKFRKMFLAQTGLKDADLGASGGGATKRVRDWFWVGEGAPQLLFNKLTKKPQFSTELLIAYAQDFRQERFGVAAAALYGLRKNQKLTEFCKTYALFAAGDGRIHFSFNPAGTQTGRWTSSTKLRLAHEDGTRTTYSCNAQQVPSKTPSFDFGEGKEKLVDSLRDIFIPDPGCVLFKCDYEALELRLIAYIHGAAKLMTWIDEGEDVHIRNAVAIFRELGLPHDSQQVKPALTELQKTINAARDAAKPLAYAVSYQMHDPDGNGRYITLFKTLKKIFPSITEQQANIFAMRFFELHPEIRDGQTRVRESIERHGYARLDIDGRCLYYPSTPRGFNQALNFHMQATGASLANRATLSLGRALHWDRGEHIRAQVHDELVVQAPFKSMERIKRQLEEAMGEVAQIGTTLAGVPAVADPGFDWGNTMAYDKFLEANPWVTTR